MAENFSLSELCFMAALAVAGAVVIGNSKNFIINESERTSSANPHRKEFQFDFLLPGNSVRPDMIPSSVIAKALSWQRTRAAKLDDSFFKAFSAELFYGFRAEVQMLAENLHKPSTESSNASDTVSDTSAHSDLVLRYLTTMRRSGELQEIIRAEINKRRNSREKTPMKDILDCTMDWIDNRRDTVFGDTHVVHAMISVIFAALHTSSQLVAHTLFELATRPDYIGALREEVEQCFEQHGQGTKEAIDSMYKIDSFIKETQRFNPLDAGMGRLVLSRNLITFFILLANGQSRVASLARVALKGFTFSNGLHIPKGGVIFTPNSPIFEDERFYPNSKTFDGFRFSRMRGDPKLKSLCDLTATNEQSMHFGTGRHACPGRFMASDEVKLAVVFILQNFDIAMENFGPRPKNHAFGKFMLPDMAAKIWLRESKSSKE
ncbi:hypothetical protein E4U31_005003 [Claviceps sp. LM219 group G6]|nr:hypothetical protein E4U31_005003 [Claviceps sp. LM219 group G6]